MTELYRFPDGGYCGLAISHGQQLPDGSIVSACPLERALNDEANAALGAAALDIAKNKATSEDWHGWVRMHSAEWPSVAKLFVLLLDALEQEQAP